LEFRSWINNLRNQKLIVKLLSIRPLFPCAAWAADAPLRYEAHLMRFRLGQYFTALSCFERIVGLRLGLLG